MAPVAEARALTLNFLEQIPRGIFGKVGIRLWDGTMFPENAKPSTTVVYKHPGSLRATLLPPNENTAAEAYLRDDYDVEGDMEGLFGWAKAMSGVGAALSWSQRAAIVRSLMKLPKPDQALAGSQREAARLRGRRHSAERDKLAVTYHYNVSNEFYALWLDANMVYSCAYFGTVNEALDAAQENKLDLICRKLRLRPGQKLLDIGCGWGGLIRHAAAHYGVEALGITLSEPQAAVAAQRIAELGLKNCDVRVLDYRALDQPQYYDAISSVGMFEHVGEAMLSDYFRQATAILKNGGVFLNHGIARNANHQSKRSSEFVKRYVFPDGELVALSSAISAAETAGLEVRDVESLREHYAITLRHWLRRLEASHEQALQFVDERTYRVWRLYMAGSAYNFDSGDLTIFQTLMVKRDRHGHSGLPLRREDWYPADTSEVG